MAEFYYDNLAKNLPDSYKKDTASNNYKIFEIEREATNELRKALDGIAAVLDIDNATGATLEMYGERFGQARGKATDSQYRAMIKSKIIRNLCDGSYKSIVDAICYTFNCSSDEVVIKEIRPMTVSLEKLPLPAIIAAGFDTRQVEQIIKNMLPIAVELESISLEGTFEFSDIENEYDEQTGFSDEEGSDVGGYLGWIGTEENEGELPI